MPQPVPFTDNSRLVRNKLSKPRITKRVKDAIDAMVARGIAYDQAAAECGLATRHMRLALEKPHVIAYYQAQLKVLRGSRAARNFHRLCEIADRQDNMPAVQALRTLEQLGDEQTTKPNAPSPGVTIRIVNVAQMPAPVDIKAAPRIIDAEPD
jgi:hypothetical protein